MKKLMFILVCFCFVSIGDSIAQLRLDVQGDAKIRGLLDVAVEGNTTSVAIGSGAGNATFTGGDNTFVGVSAGATQTTGEYNTFIGRAAGVVNSTGSFNTCVGGLAGVSLTGGSNNIYMGYRAGQVNINGSSNVTIGHEAGYSTTGSADIFIGFEAGRNATAPIGATYVGYQAGKESGGNNYNTYLGFRAGMVNNSFANTFIGYEAGSKGTGGRRNVIIGSDAGENNNGSQNVFIGRAAGDTNNAGGNNVIIGYDSRQGPSVGNTITIGANIDLPSSSLSNIAQIGNTSMGAIGGYTNWFNYSDKKFKKNIKTDVPGIEFISKLRPVTYKTDIVKLTEFLSGTNSKIWEDESFVKAANEKSKITYTGFIAQEVEAAAQEVGFDFSGVLPPASENTHYRVAYAEFVVPLVKATQEQQEIIETQKEELATVRQELADLKTLVQQLVANNTLSTPTGNTTTTVLNQPALLQQNQPNPFYGTTTIQYTLPKSMTTAQLQITDQKGQVIKTIPLTEKGKGHVELKSGTLASGTYFYSLLIDGQVQDTKQMVLTK